MTFFPFSNHILKLINRKVQEKKVFGDVILYCYLCNALCNFFMKIESSKPKARDKSIQGRKKVLCQVIVKLSVQVSYKFLIIFESAWRRELTLLYCGRTDRSSHRRFSIKKAVLKNFTISTVNTCVGVSF